MRDTLQTICDNFIQNRDTIKSTFSWDSQYMIPICASSLCEAGTMADADTLKQCRKILDSKTGIFSNFKGNVRLPIITKLAISDDPERKFDDAMAIYNILKKYFSGTEYLSLVSMILTDMISVNEAETYAARGQRIYQLMKSKHPFLTSSEDSVFAVLMAFSEKTDEELVEDMEACYTLLKKDYSDSNAVQSLSHVLALSQGTPSEKCAKVSELYQALSASKKIYGKHYELAVLGSLALIDADVSALVSDIAAVDDYLATKKGYSGFLCLDKKTRLMHAAMLTACDYAQENHASVSATAGTLAMIAAEEAAMCTVIVASAATTAANT